MKRILSIFLAMTLTASLTACSAEKVDESTSAAPETTEEVHETISPEVPYPDGDKYYEFDCSKDLDEGGFHKTFNPSDYVTLPESLKINIPYDVYTPSAQTLNDTITDIIDFYGTREEIKDKVIEDGDTVNIDYVGYVDGVAFENGNTYGYGADVTIGVTKYIPGFLEQLIGHKPGDSFDINVTFPADYGKDELNGKDAVFKTTVNYVAGELKLPELTDEFVAEKLKNNYGWSTVQEMKDDLSKNLSSDAVNNYIFDYLKNNSTVSEIPNEMTVYFQNYFVYFHSYLAEGNEVTLPQLLKNMGFDSMKAALEDYSSDIEDACRNELIVQAAAKSIGLEITDQDITDYFSENLGRTDYTTYASDFGLPYVKKMVMSWVLLRYLAETANYIPQ